LGALDKNEILLYKQQAPGAALSGARVRQDSKYFGG
jgi:hypothetical protein